MWARDKLCGETLTPSLQPPRLLGLAKAEPAQCPAGLLALPTSFGGAPDLLDSVFPLQV